VAHDPELRAGDADRERTAELLRRAHTEGRLDLDEFDLRLDQAYRAKTLGELAELTRDLPALPQPPPAPVPARADGSEVLAHRDMRRAWAAWASVVLICTVIWGTSAISSGSTQGFWPIWVAGPWGAVLLARTLFRT
jgi:hypothetical protein